ncbi:MAG: trimeric intracellular cation channel family protein [Planctomycetes bacterium]|nr:trimeric intracellular cation channel family protein [Planctomycetota bacterium]
MLQFLELMAVIAAASFGVLLARSKHLDPVGCISVTFVVSFGGGTLRDVLLDRQPLFWIQHEHYAWIVFAIAVVGSLLPRLPSGLDRWLAVPDAIGMALFSIAGAGVAVRTEAFVVSPFLASLFGVMTGTFGGVLGDIAVNEVPRLFQPTTPLYATCAFVGCWVYLLLRETALGADAALWIGAAAIVALRLAALRWNLRLPGPRR